MQTTAPLLLLPFLLAIPLGAPSVRAGAPAGDDAPDATAVVRAAIAKGAPRYDAGDAEACVRIYDEAAGRLLAMGNVLPELDRMDLEAARRAPAVDTRERAWALRRAFDRILSNAAFEMRREAALPEGFPAPGPIGRVVEASYPRYRAARAEGRSSFWSLFRHIQQNDVKMTAPVEMTLDERMRERNMAFLYERPDQGEAGRQGRVDVLDLEPVIVLSVGVRGPRSKEMVARARLAIEARLAADGYERAGDWRLLGYNSPMVPAERRFWELQVPVVRTGS